MQKKGWNSSCEYNEVRQKKGIQGTEPDVTNVFPNYEIINES